ncbi:MAG: hypothetical protein OET44_19845 [Gammaproteobacteria bacterium]|nr:hypothetical protein [Gammaproteobacteria bacterium]
MRSRGFKLALIAAVLSLTTLSANANITTLVVRNESVGAENNVPISFAQVFGVGDVPGGTVLGGTLSDGAIVPLQVDAKATHPDGSIRHAVISAIVPSLPAFGAQQLTVGPGGTAPSGGNITIADVMATSFDATVSADVDGNNYSASARDLLGSGPATQWLSGPMAAEWLVGAPLRLNGNGTEHPHLTAYFQIRVYQGLQRIRVSVVLENNWSLVAAPRNFTYDATVTLDGSGVVVSQNNVTHYRQARWRRAFWWGPASPVHIEHERSYLETTLAVPTYDPRLNVPENALAQMDNEWSGSATALMGAGFIDPYMPGGGGRRDIAPLPRWTARYLMTQDARAKRATLGNSEQAGSFGIHYRDRDTGLPISLDTYPNLTILGETPFFPNCGGSCNTPYDPDVSHQPSLAYVPYLVTGDYFHLEELQFWANWNAFYWGNHGGSLGLLVGDQVRAQAWGLRTIAHAAFITPDNHPLKNYFIEKLNNNLDWYDDNYSNSPPTPLGYVLNDPDLGIDDAFATWMDDFLTWSIGHIVNLGFSNAIPFFTYKARFPVGRLVDPDYCWTLASTYWTRARDTDGQPYQTWGDYRVAVIQTWNNDTLGPSFGWDPPSSTPGMSNGQIPALTNAACDSQAMADILGLQRGEMIGYAWDHQGYPANLQPAVAMVAELASVNGEAAWSVFDARSVVPDFGNYDYNADPQWAVVPANIIGPRILLSADPFQVSANGHSTLTWSTLDADSCSASGGWSGSKAVAGSETVGPIAGDTTYTLSCVNDEGENRRSVTITISDGSGGGSGGLHISWTGCFGILLLVLMKSRYFGRRC